MEKNIRKLLNILFLVLLALFVRIALEIVYQTLELILEFSPTAGFFIRTLFLVVVLIIWISVTLRSDSVHHKLSWLLILFFEPVIGLTLFLSFGRSFKNSKRYKKRPLLENETFFNQSKPYNDDDIFKETCSLTKRAVFKNTKVLRFKNGEAYYPHLIETLKNAKESILFEVYIFRSDTRGKEILNILIDQAEKGLDVKIILDAFGSLSRLSRFDKKRLKASKVDLLYFDRVYFPFFNTRLNYRNHRKIIVVDGAKGYLGGMNIGDEYDNSILYDYHFRDTHLFIEGDGIRSLVEIFLKDYYYLTGIVLDENPYIKTHPINHQSAVQIIESGPNSKVPYIRDTYLHLIHHAKKSIKIMTPYMAIDAETFTALKSARARGVKIDIIIPGIPDKYLVYIVTKYFAHAFSELDIHVYTYQPGFTHAKIFMVDDSLVSVGSYNLDNRSAMIDFEITLLSNDQTLIKDLTDDFNQDLLDSVDIKEEKRNLFTRLFEGLLSLFSPII
ncbi:MAG: cardiolipin synthase [Candidatus Izemoplasmataceae bacterium]